MTGVRQISVFASNRPGKTAAITGVLAEAGINIMGMNIASSGDFGVIKFLVNDLEKADRALREKGFTISLNEVLAIEMEDVPGGLHRIADLLYRKNINVEYSYGLPMKPHRNAILIIEVEDVEQAKLLLKNEPLRFLSEPEIQKERG